MPCKADSECSVRQQCVDGECVSISDKDEGESFGFAEASARYLRDYQAEERAIDIYSRFLGDEIEEAVHEREEAAEDIGFWGKVGQIAGAAVGFVVGGPAGAVIGSGIGSGGARYLADEANNAESYGLSQVELDRLSTDDLKFLKSEFWDIRDEYEHLQQNLDDYDDTEWKRHVSNTLGDMWQTYQLASLATGVYDQFTAAAAEKKLVNFAEESTVAHASADLAEASALQRTIDPVTNLGAKSTMTKYFPQGRPQRNPSGLQLLFPEGKSKGTPL